MEGNIERAKQREAEFKKNNRQISNSYQHQNRSSSSSSSSTQQTNRQKVPGEVNNQKMQQPFANRNNVNEYVTINGIRVGIHYVANDRWKYSLDGKMCYYFFSSKEEAIIEAYNSIASKNGYWEVVEREK